jgi:hypothetical protein
MTGSILHDLELLLIGHDVHLSVMNDIVSIAGLAAYLKAKNIPRS